jgi:hypothetical protein
MTEKENNLDFFILLAFCLIGFGYLIFTWVAFALAFIIVVFNL